VSLAEEPPLIPLPDELPSDIRPVPLHKVQLTRPLLQLKLLHGMLILRSLSTIAPRPSQVLQFLPPAPLQVVQGRVFAYTVVGTLIVNNITTINKTDNILFIFILNNLQIFLISA
jgi:hypothetical protein